MNIEFPCPESIGNMQKSENGFHCNSCNESVYDLSKISPSQFENLIKQGQKICTVVYSNSEKDATYSISKFALALLIVFGAGLFTFSNAQIEKQIIDVNDSLATCPITPGKVIVSVQNKHKNLIWANVSLILPNGKMLTFEENSIGIYSIEIPSYAIGKDIEVSVMKGRLTKTEVIKLESYGEIVDLDYVFYSKKAIRRFRTMGCPSF